MKRLLRFLPLFLAIPLMTGMGTISSTEVARTIPRPEQSFTAVLLDQMDVVTECTDISVEGDTFFDGKRGKGFYRIPFENIDRVSFFMNNAILTGRFTLLEGEELIELVLDRDRRVFGTTRWGTYQIRLGDLKTIKIIDPARKNP